MFKFNSAVSISNSLDLYDYGQLDFMVNGSMISLYKAKLIAPSSLSFGTFTQNAISLSIEAIPNDAGQLIEIDNESGFITTEASSYLTTEERVYLIIE